MRGWWITEVDPGALARINSAPFGNMTSWEATGMTSLHTVDTLIIGAGLAGLSTALHRGGDLLIVEAENYIGGKARSEVIDGFTFDVTGHWLHLRDPEIRSLILDLMGPDHFMSVSRMSRIWSHGVYTRYPFQANTYGLPADVIKECLLGAIEADRKRGENIDLDAEPESFSEWIRLYFGDGIAQHFMIPYNAKLWGVSADEITSRWCQRFVPRPNLEDIVAGAVGCNDREMGYNAQFLYPKRGGIQTVAEALADAVGREKILLEAPVVSIDATNKEVRLRDGRTIGYQNLVNTSPLPLFIDLMDGVPETVCEARTKLRANEVVYLNVGIDGPLGQPDHWIYVPEEKWPMYRVGSFSNANPAMAPSGCSSLYIELSDRDTPIEDLRPVIEEGLVSMGLIKSRDAVRFMVPRRIQNAYVIYDFVYHQSRSMIHDWLGSVGVHSIGH